MYNNATRVVDEIKGPRFEEERGEREPKWDGAQGLYERCGIEAADADGGSRETVPCMYKEETECDGGWGSVCVGCTVQ